MAVSELLCFDVTAPMKMNGRQDFDFLYGQWLVRNRRRQQCFGGSDDWNEFDSMHKCWPLLDGFGNVDEHLCDDHSPAGALMHFFDARNWRWRMHWLSPRGGVQPPIEGVFRNGVGRFYGETRLDGRPILVRYLWDKSEPGSPFWEQAFSEDDGNTWETNWTMQFTRLDWPLEPACVSIDAGPANRSAPAYLRPQASAPFSLRQA